MSVRRIVLPFIIIFCLSIISSTSIFAASGTDNLEGYWRLDETTAGSTVTDSSGDGESATPNGSPSPSTTVPSAISFTNLRSLNFDADTKYVDTPLAFPSSGGTIALWAYPTSISDWRSPAGWKLIGANNGYILLDMGNASKWRAVFRPNNSGNAEANVSAASTFSTNNWYHLAMTWTVSAGTYTLELYVNGVSQGTTTWSGSVGSSGVGTFNMGKSGDYADNYFRGNIDDVRVYSRALSATEIDALSDGLHTSATWDGSSSTDTEVAANWDINAVPDTYTRLTIADVTNQPVATANISMAGLTINTGAWFDLSMYNLTMNDSGNFSNLGTLRLKNSQTISGFANDTDSGTILINPTTNTTGLKTGNSYYNLLLNDGLMGYWKFDETSQGSSAIDSSGYDNSGSPYGTGSGPSFGTTLPTVNFTNPRSAVFNGTDQYFSMGSSGNLYNTAFTLSAWLYPTEYTNNYARVAQQRGTGAGGFGIEFDSGDAGCGNQQVYGAIWTSAGDATRICMSSGTISLNTWHHVVLTYSGGTGTLYVNATDGNSDGSASVTLGAPTSNLFTIGRAADGTGNFFKGNIDDVRFYNHVLSTSEIASLASGDIPAATANSTTLSAAVDINNDLILNTGTLDVDSSNSYGVTIGGDIENNGGVFTSRSGTVTLDGGNQSITSSNTFYNLTKSVTAAYTVTFAQRSVTTITNTTTFGGTASNLLSLRSAMADTQFKINPQGTRVFSYLDVDDSNNINATAIAYVSSITYGDNLTNWNTVAPTSTPTPTPTPTPTSTPAFTRSSSSSSTTLNSASPPVCQDRAPAGVPDLFRIVSTETTATLYFTPVSGVSEYYISYSTSPSAEEHGAEVTLGSEGVRNYTVNQLSSNSMYYFKVRGQNGCRPGEWSRIVSEQTTTVKNDPASLLTNVSKTVNKTVHIVAEKAATIPLIEKTVEKKIEIKKTEISTKPMIFSYIVKTGDSLWSIAQQVLGTGTQYVEIVEQNIKEYPELISKKLSIGSRLNILQNNPPQKVRKGASSQKLYDLDVRILAKNNKPLRGVAVTIHSDPMTEVTDNEGIARFKGVMEGEHKIYLAYNGYDGGGQSINITGDNKNVELVMQVDLKASFYSPAVMAVFIVMGLVITILLYIILRRQRH